MSEPLSFAQEIEQNKDTEAAPAASVHQETAASSLDVRLRGAYITDCQLTDPISGEPKAILFGEDAISKSKMTATHPMVPAGPYEGIGGQHGFPRWSDYHKVPLPDGPNGEKEFGLQAIRSDSGLSLVKTFSLGESSLTTNTTIANSTNETERTSIGEHLYFALPDENMGGLKVDGRALDDLLEGSEALLNSQKTLVMPLDGKKIITFPDGRRIKLSAQASDPEAPLRLWIWKRAGSPSICFEPVVGVVKDEPAPELSSNTALKAVLEPPLRLADDDHNQGLAVKPYGSATLTTTIELLKPTATLPQQNLIGQTAIWEGRGTEQPVLLVGRETNGYLAGMAFETDDDGHPIAYQALGTFHESEIIGVGNTVSVEDTQKAFRLVHQMLPSDLVDTDFARRLEKDKV